MVIFIDLLYKEALSKTNNSKYMQNKIVIIVGPTASGKTNFAHKLAKQCKGEVINADSMQLYKQLPILTSSPKIDLKSEIAYHLYNFLDLNEEFSAAKYANMASDKAKDLTQKNIVPIIVGGSGMYINMLLYGYSDIPHINPDIRQNVRNLRDLIGPEEFYAKLITIDPDSKDKLKIHDSQRVIRAYEVFQQTGKTLAYFQNQDNICPLRNYNMQVIFLLPERKFLYSTCNQRFINMLALGAIEEVELARINYANIPGSANKALGFKEITEYLDNKITKEELIELATLNTRRYAKRQITWFKHQIKNQQIIEFSNAKEYENKVDEFIKSF